MELYSLKKISGNKTKSKRVGRGIGSGKGGHTTGRGIKGQKARKGNRKPWFGFEGGQVPLYKRLPRMGKFRPHHVKFVIAVNVDRLNVFKNGDEVTPQLLADRGIIDKIPSNGVKILAGGKLDKKLVLKGFHFSESAKEKVNKSGSSIVE